MDRIAEIFIAIPKNFICITEYGFSLNMKKISTISHNENTAKNPEST